MVYIYVIFTSADGVHALTQVVSHWPLTTEVQVQSQTSQCGTCGVKSDAGTFFFDSISMIPPVFHILILIRLQTQSYQSESMALFMVLIC
jgi:hypothetical protein